MADSDVLIIGAGPAGSTLAYLLADAGLSVLVLDRAPGASFKIGESLLPEGVRLCHEMGLEAELRRGPFLQKSAAQFILSEDGACDRFCFADALRADRQSTAYQVKRQDFDSLLHRHAQSAGAQILWGFNVREVRLGAEDHVAVTDADGRRMTGRYLVDASGLTHVVGRQLRVAEPLPNLGKIAMFSHFDGIPRDVGERAGDIRVIWNPTGWFWVIPFHDGTTSVGVVGDPNAIQRAGGSDQERFDNLCSQSEVHKSLLGDREQLLRLQRCADYSFRCKAQTGERFLMVGDAAGFLDPIFSTGVFMAQVGAFLARDAIAAPLCAGELPALQARRDYENKIGLGARRYLALVLQFYDRKFMDDVIRSRRREHTRRALTSLLAGDIFDEDNPILRMGMLGASYRES